MAQKGKRGEDAAQPAGSAHLTLPDKVFLSDLQEEILQWYAQNGRDLPWRRTQDPYKILVSELMLQQTQAPRVIPKYDAFIERFPHVQILAEAPLGEVLKYWSGLGYNRRAQYLHRAAQYVAADLGGDFPKDEEELRKLPGVGSYTAGAIAAFAFNQDVVILETNIRRVYQLLFSGDDGSEPTNQVIAAALLPSGRARDWYHALMDLATEIRTSRSAATQQQHLRELFPLLTEYQFPVFTEEQVIRPRQSTFAGSHRFFRGQILKRLQAGSLSQSALVHELEEEKVTAALKELIKEGLVLREPFDDLYRLP